MPLNLQTCTHPSSEVRHSASAAAAAGQQAQRAQLSSGASAVWQQHGRATRRRRSAAVVAAAPSSGPAELLNFEFPHRGTGLLWARSTGLKLWPGAALLARALREERLLASLHPRLAGRAQGGGWRLEDRLVLELGCGLGLVACTAAWLGARVVATDGDRDLLRVRGLVTQKGLVTRQHSKGAWFFSGPRTGRHV